MEDKGNRRGQKNAIPRTLDQAESDHISHVFSCMWFNMFLNLGYV